MGRVADMVDPSTALCAHLVRGRPTSNSHHLDGKHTPATPPLALGLREAHSCKIRRPITETDWDYRFIRSLILNWIVFVYCSYKLTKRKRNSLQGSWSLVRGFTCPGFHLLTIALTLLTLMVTVSSNPNPTYPTNPNTPGQVNPRINEPPDKWEDTIYNAPLRVMWLTHVNLHIMKQQGLAYRLAIGRLVLYVICQINVKV